MNNLEKDLDKVFPCDCAFTLGFGYKQGQPCSGRCVTAAYRSAARALVEKHQLLAVRDIATPVFDNRITQIETIRAVVNSKMDAYLEETDHER
jgi:hypothetical protein